MASSELKMKPRLALSTLKNPCVYHSFDVINKNMFFFGVAPFRKKGRQPNPFQTHTRGAKFPSQTQYLGLEAYSKESNVQLNTDIIIFDVELNNAELASPFQSPKQHCKH